jgi:hypothetical protein
MHKLFNYIFPPQVKSSFELCERLIHSRFPWKDLSTYLKWVLEIVETKTLKIVLCLGPNPGFERQNPELQVFVLKFTSKSH